MKKAIVIFVVICSLLLLAIIAFFKHEQIEDQKMRERIKPWVTHGRLIFVASWCDTFREQRGVWPKSIQELRDFTAYLRGSSIQDAWGRAFILTPYNDSLGYGNLISYGRDGKPGGIGQDRDMEIRFPTNTWEKWNRQEGIGLEQPNREP
jgi:hypothetical protein